MKIFHCRGAEHGVASIDNVTHAAYNLQTAEIVDPGDADYQGDAGSLVTHNTLTGTVFCSDPEAARNLLDSAAANLVIKFANASGNQKVTIKNVLFVGLTGEVAVPARDGGGTVQRHGATFRAQWGSSDTRDLMIVHAADA
jgi:hypothetical protein